MSRTRLGISGATLVLLLLAGCGSGDAGGQATTEEALLGGIETVAPDEGAEDVGEGIEDAAGALTAQAVVDSIMAAGAYTCTPASSSEWDCTAQDSALGALQVTGSSEGDLTISGDAPVDGDTVAAIAELVGAGTDEIYSDDAGLAWAAS